jgi:outer membrane protein, multidrug efflux system
MASLSMAERRTALASDFDLDEEPAPQPTSLAIRTIKPHAYTLLECLAAADRNHPSLWAAKARVAVAHAQLTEAKWAPYSNWSSQMAFGAFPNIGGSPLYGATPREAVNNPGVLGFAGPIFRFEINGGIPLWTFGKISSIREAAEADVRRNEWDAEKFRQQVRMDVRRAYFGLKLARDSRFMMNDVSKRLEDASISLQAKLDKHEGGVDEIDKTRLEVERDIFESRRGEIDRGERKALAALRFMTGIENNFDIVDEPLKRPTIAIRPLVSYLTAARLYRPEINMARAGVVARNKYLEYERARMYPDLVAGFGATYTVAPTAVPQTTAWIGDPFNFFSYQYGALLRWNMDFFAQQARVAKAESFTEETRALSRLATGGVAVEVEEQYGNVLEAKKREEQWAKVEHRAKGWISTIRDRIDVGTADERALLEPLRQFWNARLQHAIALMDLNVTMSELARVSGWDEVAPTDE